jgi:hypothetical protein
MLFIWSYDASSILITNGAEGAWDEMSHDFKLKLDYYMLGVKFD